MKLLNFLLPSVYIAFKFLLYSNDYIQKGENYMNGISRFSLKNGVAVVILCVLVLGYGLYSSTQIKQQTFPDVSFPSVFIQAVYPGASTEEVETEITGPIEQ